MKFSLLETLATAPTTRTLFRAEKGVITAGQVRAAAFQLAHDIEATPGDLVLFTTSLSAFAAGLLGAHIAGRNVILPAHDGTAYLQEVSRNQPIATDRALPLPSAVQIAVGDKTNAPSCSPVTGDMQVTFYTSGSTAAPKAIVKSIRQLDDEADILAQAWPNSSSAPIVSTAPHHHIYGLLFRLFWPVRTGAVSDEQAKLFWGPVAEAIRAQTSILVSNPAHLSRIPPDATCRPQMVFSSGAPLPVTSATDAHHHLGVWPIEVLGSTETGGVGWRTQEAGNAAWHPLPEVQITLSDEGALQVASRHADGDDICTLGDLGEVTADGRFRTLGRIGPVVKIEGVRVSLVRVEQMIVTLPEVAACRTLTDRNGRLAAVVELTANGRAELVKDGAFRMGRALRTALGEHLSAAERPKAWRFVDAMPMNDQGKTTMAALEAMFDAQTRDPNDDTTLAFTDLNVTETEAEMRFLLDPELRWFKGHFPDLPILPGIAQVHMATQLAEQVWGWRPDGSNLMKLKFKQVVRPNATIHAQLRRDVDEGHLWFSFECNGVVTSSGRIGGRG